MKELAEQMQLSERRACRVIPAHRSSQRYQKQPESEPAVRRRLVENVGAGPSAAAPRAPLVLASGWGPLAPT